MQSFFKKARERLRSYAQGRRGTVYQVRHDANGLHVSWLTMENECGDAVCEWRQVESVIAYKRDLFAVDRIQLYINLDNGSAVEVHEEMAGWKELIEKLPTYLSGCHPPAEWWTAVAFPAFVPNATLLYTHRQVEKT